MAEIKTMAEYIAQGEQPEILFWVGCAGSFDDRAKRISMAFTQILSKVGIKFAILGQEETCTGDSAKRAGNEFLFQMMAYQNIQVLNGYEIKRIVTACPHCFNTLKNEYPELGGHYEVIHHSQLLQDLIDEGRIKLSDSSEFKGKRVTYHDSCYLGRANDVYEAPRSVLAALDVDLAEMGRSKKKGFCCGAGGAQMFKEEENGKERISTSRTEEALNTQSDLIATNCPFCTTMLEDGLKTFDKQDKVKVLDLVEMLNSSME